MARKNKKFNTEEYIKKANKKAGVMRDIPVGAPLEPRYKDRSIHIDEAENGHVVNVNRYGSGHKRYVATSKKQLKKLMKRHMGE